MPAAEQQQCQSSRMMLTILAHFTLIASYASRAGQAEPDKVPTCAAHIHQACCKSSTCFTAQAAVAGQGHAEHPAQASLGGHLRGGRCGQAGQLLQGQQSSLPSAGPAALMASPAALLACHLLGDGSSVSPHCQVHMVSPQDW